MSRDPHASYPASSTYSKDSHQQETRQTRASSTFIYSAARPPTNFSAQSWAPGQAPPVPQPRHSRPPSVDSPFGGIVEEEDEEEEEEEEELEDNRDTPLYARSDWEGEGEPATETGTGTSWSRSSFAGMTTGAPTSAAFGGLDEIEASIKNRGKVPGPKQHEEILSSYSSSGPDEASPAERGLPQMSERPPSQRTSMQQRFVDHSSHSTLPSVLDLEHLTATATGGNPFADPKPKGQTRRRKSYVPEPTPGLERNKQDSVGERGKPAPDLLTPAAHQRLGRMSVAPARYTLPPQREGSTPSRSSSEKTPSVATPNSGWNKAFATWIAYRTFANAALSLLSVILVTMTMLSSGELSTFINVPSGAFNVDAANGAEAGLGVLGWCQRNSSRFVISLCD